MRRREFIIGSVATLAMPLATGAQTATKMKRLAMVHPSEKIANMTTNGGASFRAFFEELSRLGYTQDRNLLVERFTGEGRQDQYAALARRVVDTAPDAILSMHARLALALKSLTSTIPIVAVNSDPVALGLVTNLARPGGNITGVSVDAGLEIWGKRLDVLAEATGKLTKPHFLTTPQQWDGPTGIIIREAAHRVGIPLVATLLSGDIDRSNYARAFETLREEGADTLVVSEVSENLSNRRTIVELATQYLLPAIYPYREFVDEGGLLAYSIDLVDTFRRLANQVASIFSGTSPGDIPFFQQTRFQLVTNVKAAQAIGLAMPPSLLARADEVIE
jgi:putative tryptophan/tyrosine transport system substrate-binding protein